MDVRLPRWLAIALLTSGTILLGFSVYLETERLDLLQAHPILVNLLSGLVAFCFSIPALSIVLQAVLARESFSRLKRTITDESYRIGAALARDMDDALSNLLSDRLENPAQRAEVSELSGEVEAWIRWAESMSRNLPDVARDGGRGAVFEGGFGFIGQRSSEVLEAVETLRRLRPGQVERSWPHWRMNGMSYDQFVAVVQASPESSHRHWMARGLSYDEAVDRVKARIRQFDLESIVPALTGIDYVARESVRAALEEYGLRSPAGL